MNAPSGKAPGDHDRDRDPEGDRKRIDDIDARLKAARGNVEKPRQSSVMSHRQTGVAYRVLVDMIAGLLVGGFIGYWLDRWLGWTPWSLAVGLVVGFAAGVNNAWRAIRVYSEDAAKGDGDRLP
ncbi:MAG: AtpZ/AtpI family protein [Reyranellales bacterium]